MAEHETCLKNYTCYVPSTVLNCFDHNGQCPMDMIKWEASLKYQLWCKLVKSRKSAKKGTDATFLNFPQERVNCRKRQQVCHYMISLYDRGFFSSAAESFIYNFHKALFKLQILNENNWKMTDGFIVPAQSCSSVWWLWLREASG